MASVAIIRVRAMLGKGLSGSPLRNEDALRTAMLHTMLCTIWREYNPSQEMRKVIEPR